jgi:hypothetical protein
VRVGSSGVAPGTPAVTPFIYSGRWWAWLVVLLPTLVIALSRWNAGAGLTVEDYAQYLLHARALVEGRPYGDTGYIWTKYAPFVSPRLMPPGEPLLLAAVFLATGFSYAAAKVVTLGSLLAFALVAGRAVAAHEGRAAGLMVTTMLGLAAPVMAFSTTANSDLTYCAVVWSIILLADGPGAWSWRRTAAIAVLGLYSIAVRTVGVVLVPAMLVVAISRRRELGWRGFVPPALCSAVGFVAVLATPESGGLSRAILRLLQRGNLRVLGNMRSYELSAFETLLYPFPFGLANDLWHAAALVLVVAGLVTWIRPAANRLALSFGVVYLGALAMLPLASDRYLWPLAPLILLGLWRGLRIGADVLERRWSWWPRWAVAAAVATIAVAGAIRLSLLPPPRSLAAVPNVQRLFAEVRVEAARGPMRVAFFKPRVLTLETGVPAMSLFEAPPPVVLAELRRRCITHVVIGSPGTRLAAGRAFNRTVAWRAQLFTRVYTNEAFHLYRFEGGPCADADVRTP